MTGIASSTTDTTARAEETDVQTLVPEDLAERIDLAQRTGEPIEQFGSGLTLNAAYEVQGRLLQLRQARGERLTGAKLGFTSEAKMAQMGVDEIIVGFVTDEMELQTGQPLETAGLVHPRVEPEVAFRLSREITPGMSSDQIVASVDAVAAGLEVIDSRYRDFRFSLSDVVADNTSASRYVIGEWRKFRHNVDHLAVSLFVDGQVVETGNTTDILGHPVRSLERLAHMLPTLGYAIPAGSVILAGAATAAVPAAGASRITAIIAELGEVDLPVIHSGTAQSSTERVVP